MDIGMERFLKVRNALNTPSTRLEYNRCYKKPWKFYKTYSVEEAIEILKREAKGGITMKNINMFQAEPNRDHWIVKADTKRFGAQAVMFESDFDTAIGYIGQNVFQTDVEHFTVHITGEHEGRRFDNDWLTVHRNGYIEQDWSKIF